MSAPVFWGWLCWGTGNATSQNERSRALPVDSGPLRKILELERSKGYLDAAVIGGLDRFLGNWAGQVSGAITNRQLLSHFQRVVRSSYAAMTTSQRENWIGNMLDLLAEIENAGVEKPKTKSSLLARPLARAEPPPVRNLLRIQR